MCTMAECQSIPSIDVLDKPLMDPQSTLNGYLIDTLVNTQLTLEQCLGPQLVESIGVRATFCRGGGGVASHLPKKLS